MEKLDWMRAALDRLETDAAKRGWAEMLLQIAETRRVLSVEAGGLQQENVIRVDFRTARISRHQKISIFP